MTRRARLLVAIVAPVAALGCSAILGLSDPTILGAEGGVDATMDVAAGDASDAGKPDGDAGQDVVTVKDACPDGWVPTGSLLSAAAGGSAVVLGDGHVLLVSGELQGAFLPISQLYDPQAGSWSDAGKTTSHHYRGAAVRMKDGRVLVVGGWSGSSGAGLKTAEIYDSKDGGWSSALTPTIERQDEVAFALANGNVMVAGGEYKATTDIYDPMNDSWVAGPPMNTARSHALLALLSNNRVLVVGGQDGSTDLITAEMFDGAQWVQVASPAKRHQGGFAIGLASGSALVVGGSDALGGGAVPFAEIFDPSDGGAWSMAGYPDDGGTRLAVQGTRLADGRVLLAGGQSGSPAASLASTTIFDPNTLTWKPGPPLQTDRAAARVATLLDGRVIVLGGYRVVNGSISMYLDTSELLPCP